MRIGGSDIRARFAAPNEMNIYSFHLSRVNAGSDVHEQSPQCGSIADALAGSVSPVQPWRSRAAGRLRDHPLWPFEASPGSPDGPLGRAQPAQSKLHVWSPWGKRG